MKTLVRQLTLCLLVILGMTYTRQTVQASTLCLSGLHWSMTDRSSAWGKGYPVVKAVRPYSMAEKAGLRTGDLIIRVGNTDTYSLSAAQISALLEQDSPQLITYRRLGGQVAQTILAKECKRTVELNERELAELLAHYSPEDSSLESVSYPFAYQVSPELSLADAKTFSFAPSSASSLKIDTELNKLITNTLLSRGLQLVEQQGDLIVSTYYSIQSTGQTPSGANQHSLGWRFDPKAHIFAPVPIVTGSSSLQALAQYKLTLGISLQKRRMPTQLWQVESSEYLSEGMSIEDYARLTIPLMLQPFGTGHTPTAGLHCEIQTLRYYYTGLSYAKDELNRIVDVVHNSPAWRAGLRPGDRVRAINGIRIRKEQTEDILEDYISLLEQTDRYRLVPTNTLNPEQHSIKARYWDPSHYSSIAHAISRGRSEAAYAYIFAFRPYISQESITQLVFDIERRDQRHTVLISPILRDETTIIPL